MAIRNKCLLQFGQSNLVKWTGYLMNITAFAGKTTAAKQALLSLNTPIIIANNMP
jgi:hypothetical protein